MKKLCLTALLTLLLMMSTAGCIDKNYDLSNIDTTAQFTVVDLVVPVNIDAILLENILKTSKDFTVIDGVYAYVKDGTFSSDPIRISDFNVHIGDISPAYAVMESGGVPVPGVDVSYEASDISMTDVDFRSQGIDGNVCAVTLVRADIALSLHLDFSSLKGAASRCETRNLTLQLPSGLVLAEPSAQGSYDAATGLFRLNNTLCETASGLDLRLRFSAMQIPAAAFDYSSHTIHISRELGISSGGILLPAKYQTAGATLPSDISVRLDCSVADFNVANIDGKIRYVIRNMDVPRIEMTGLPDFLAQEGTDLRLKNPCLYIATNNPLDAYGVFVETGFEITAYRGTTPSGPYRIDGETFIVGGREQQPVEGRYSFVLSPEAPQRVVEGYPKPLHVGYKALSDVLAGDGIPSALQPRLVNPLAPEQAVSEFRLGENFGSVEGSYRIIADLQLNAGSAIVYNGKVSDLWSEDMDRLTITAMDVALSVSTDIPATLTLSAVALDKDGKAIPGVRLTADKIEANTEAQPVTVTAELPEGGFCGLGGLSFYVTSASVDGAPLAPDMQIKLADIRPRVSGYFIKKL